jgi:hypothetical protein
MSKPMDFNWCPTCRASLDTGWECNGCERDWITYAVPWWVRWRSALRVWWENS